MKAVDVIWVADQTALAQHAARHVGDLVRGRDAPTIALPTGDTPIGMYRQLAADHRDGKISFRQARLFNLDEYVGMAPDHPQSYHAFLHRHFLDHIDVAPQGVRLLCGDTPDADEECSAYDSAIAAAGGLDLAILGLGANGHIAFNEPGDPWDRETHCVTLAERTREAHRPNFKDESSIPRFGLTMGVKMLAAARNILLLCAGQSKREAMAALLAGVRDAAWPVTSIADHPRLTVIAEANLKPDDATRPTVASVREHASADR